MIAAP